MIHSPSIDDLRAELISDSYLRKRHAGNNTRVTLEGVANFGLVDVAIIARAGGLLLGMAQPELETFVSAVASHVGSVTDPESNRMMARLAGDTFIPTLKLFTYITAGSSYDNNYPRRITENDKEQALVLDARMAQHAAGYLQTDEGKALLEKVTDTFGAPRGCPLMHAPTEENTIFDTVTRTVVSEYCNPGSAYYMKGYKGLAELTVEKIAARNASTDEIFANPNLANSNEFKHARPYDWNLPVLEVAPL